MKRRHSFLGIAVSLFALCLIFTHAKADEGRVMLRDGTGLYYVEKGSRQAHESVLFIHGWSCSSRYWREQLNALSSRYRVVAVDLRGHGRSDKPSYGYTLGYLAEDIHEVIERLRLERTFIVGWSMGGSVLFEYLRKFRGEYLKGAVFVDIGPYSWKTGDYPIGYSDYEKRLELTREYAMAYQDPKNDQSSFISRMFVRKPAPQVLQDLVGDYSLVPPFVRSLLIIELYASDYRSLLPKIEVPTLIVMGSWGGEKGVGSTGEYMRNRIKNATYIRFSESGHCPFMEEPERFNRVLSEFVEANSSPRGGK